jgi:hypothetical protein
MISSNCSRPRKKLVLVQVVIAATFTFFFAAAVCDAKPKPTPTPTPKPTCPLPADYGIKKTVSPEKPLEAVCHNGMILCLPQSAAQAHIQHGDTDLGPCSKPGNNGPCP